VAAARRFAPVTLDNLDELPTSCRSCVFWEIDPVRAARLGGSAARAAEKESWVSATLLDWGSCGRLLHVDGDLAGYVLYAPPAYVPRAAAFPTSPVAADAVVLMGIRVLPEHRGAGLGRQLIQAVAKDMSTRGVRAIEAFGSPRSSAAPCLVPADFLLSVGFKTVRPHPRVPRLRLDLRSAITWREDVEAALERLLGAVQAPVHAALPGGANRSAGPG
jgi:GNAT superfamily N-acetyltransferase